MFPNVSVIAKTSCRDVEHAVFGIRESGELHWLNAFGLVDNDRRSPPDIDRLKQKKVYALSVFSVESVYYHADVQRRVTERHATVTGENAEGRIAAAKAAAIAAVRPHANRLSERVVEKMLREEVFRMMPGREQIAAGTPVNISIDVATAVASEKLKLQQVLDADDLSNIIARYPVRETPALSEIAIKLGFRNRDQYEGAVRKLAMDDDNALSFMRALFGDLATEINS